MKECLALLKGNLDWGEIWTKLENTARASKNKITDFDEGLFYALVDKVIVNKDKIIVKWRDGTKGKKGSHFFIEKNRI